MLVQVERTGKDQREDGKVIRSQQVKEYLMPRLGVSEAEIAIKTSDQDDFEKERIQLLEEGCRTNWIITKAALQEGWDCPFAYILVSLNNTGSSQSMTQLIGRVLRQPPRREGGGGKISWQELGEGFDQQQFRFQVLDDGDFENWREKLEEVLG